MKTGAAARAGAAVLSVTLALCAFMVCPQSADARTVRVGVYQNQPKVFQDSRGRGAGFFIDLLADVAEKEGWTIRQVPCEWADCLEALNDGRIDIMPDVAWSPERARRFDFHTTPVIESWSQVYARPGTEIESLLSLEGRKVAVLRNSIQQATFEQLVSGLGVNVQVVLVDTIEDAFLLVKAGRVDAAVSNHFFGDYFCGSYGLIKTGVVFQPVSVYFASGRGRNPDLLAAIENDISVQRATPNSQYYKTLSRWMAGPRPNSVIPRYFIWILAGALGLLAITLGVSALLRRQIRVKTAHLAAANAELKRTQAALMDSEALLKVTQEMAGVGGWEYDVDQMKMVWTEETLRIHGFRRGDSQDGTIDLVHSSLDMYEPADREIVNAAFQRCIRDGAPYDMEAGFKPADGPRLTIRTSGRAVRDSSGRIVKIVGTFQDITRMKAEQQARVRAEEELRIARRLETMGRLTGGIAHDFNNLLSVIRGYTDLILRRRDVPPAVRNDIVEVQKAGESAANLTHQLLAFGSRGILQHRVLSINTVATGLEKMLKRLIAANIDISVHLSGDAGTVMADRGQMEQVIINLVINARDAMPGGGKLSIETAGMEVEGEHRFGGTSIGPGRWMVLTVADTGCGMNANTVARIFEPFFTTKDVGRGTGLGLATVLSIVSQAGGRVGVESEVGKGSVFKVFLPRCDLPEYDASVAKSAGFTTGSGTILLVDGDVGARTVAERILVDAGYRVMAVDDGEEALNMCHRHSQEIDLLLTDLVVPGMDGITLAEKATLRYPRISVLFMSGYAEAQPAAHPLLDMKRNFLAKPFSADELTTIVSRVMNEAEPV